MFWLKDHIEKIEALINEGASHSLTYAALEARIALELVCYERLRNAHDYISHADIKRWQPHHVMTTLIQEVNPLVAREGTLSISKMPAQPGVGAEQLADDDFIKVGTQVGFDSKKLGRLWQALGNFLHVRMPETKADKLSSYSDVEVVRAKLAEVLEELRILEKGTLIISGMGKAVRFECGCGQNNARRADLLKAGQIVSCFNKECKESWEAIFEGDEINFKRRSIELNCGGCSKPVSLPEAWVMSIERSRPLHFECKQCGTDNRLAWRLMHEMKKAAA